MRLCIFSPQGLDSWWVWGSGNICYTGMDKYEHLCGDKNTVIVEKSNYVSLYQVSSLVNPLSRLEIGQNSN